MTPAITPMSTTTAAAPALRTATPADLPAVERLLIEAGLPTAGVADLFAGHADDFVVADDPGVPGEFAGVAGLEVCYDPTSPDGSRCDNASGATALLRSVAVRPDWRAHGLGRDLVRYLVSVAEGRGLRALYLLTITAEHYFPRLGFARVARADVPAEIAATLEFRSACPASAVAMARIIPAGAPSDATAPDASGARGTSPATADSA